MNLKEQNYPLWMQDDLVKGIPKEKLDFLGKVFQESSTQRQGSTQKEMMTLLIPMLQKAKQQNLSFTPQEMAACIAAIKKYSSQEEVQQIDKILSKVK